MVFINSGLTSTNVRRITIISAYGMYTMIVTYHSPDATCTYPPSPLLPNATNITLGDGMYTWMWALAEYNTGIIVACMPSMLLFLRWVRGDMDKNKKPLSGSHPTIGGGGGGGRGRPTWKSETSEIHTRISMAHENDEDGIREVGGIIKSEELVTVETASDTAGSMC